MKTLVAVTIACLLSTIGSAQNRVDIQLTNPTSAIYEVTLIPNESTTGILSNVVFALKWKTGQIQSIGEPTPLSIIQIRKSGSIKKWGEWEYQLYSGCGFVNGPIESFTVAITYVGSGQVVIAEDDFTKQENGQYYVSIGGQEVTGFIVGVKSNEQDPNPITLYYDRLLGRFYVKRDGVFYDLAGQRVIMFNESELVIVRKRN